MPWGTGPWGITPWGIAGPIFAPTLIGVSPGIVSRLGGDVVTIVGTNFSDPIVIEILLAGDVVGTCYVFDVEFDLDSTRIHAGTPALDDGVYDMQVTTTAGPSAVLIGALEYRLFAEQMKAQRVNIGFAAPWAVGSRLLSR